MDCLGFREIRANFSMSFPPLSLVSSLIILMALSAWVLYTDTRTLTMPPKGWFMLHACLEREPATWALTMQEASSTLLTVLLVSDELIWNHKEQSFTRMARAAGQSHCWAVACRGQYAAITAGVAQPSLQQGLVKRVLDWYSVSQLPLPSALACDSAAFLSWFWL